MLSNQLHEIGRVVDPMGRIGKQESNMHRIFPRPLVTCIAEGRSPHIAEFEDLAATVLRQSFAGCSRDNAAKFAERVADVAFHGRRTFR